MKYVSAHIFIEVAWIVLGTIISVKLSKLIYNLFTESISPENFVAQLRKMKNFFFILFSLVILGAIIEVFISPFIL